MISNLEITNFKKFNGYHCIEFLSSGESDCFNVVVGRNGSGKSCVMEALEWVLLGTSSKKLRSENTAALINDLASDKIVKVSIKIILPDGKSMQISKSYDTKLRVTGNLFVGNDCVEHWDTGKQVEEALRHYAGISSTSAEQCVIPQHAASFIARKSPLDLLRFLEESLNISIVNSHIEGVLNGNIRTFQEKLSLLLIEIESKSAVSSDFLGFLIKYASDVAKAEYQRHFLRVSVDKCVNLIKSHQMRLLEETGMLTTELNELRDSERCCIAERTTILNDVHGSNLLICHDMEMLTALKYNMENEIKIRSSNALRFETAWKKCAVSFERLCSMHKAQIRNSSDISSAETELKHLEVEINDKKHRLTESMNLIVELLSENVNSNKVLTLVNVYVANEQIFGDLCTEIANAEKLLVKGMANLENMTSSHKALLEEQVRNNDELCKAKVSTATAEALLQTANSFANVWLQNMQLKKTELRNAISLQNNSKTCLELLKRSHFIVNEFKKLHDVEIMGVLSDLIQPVCENYITAILSIIGLYECVSTIVVRYRATGRLLTQFCTENKLLTGKFGLSVLIVEDCPEVNVCKNIPPIFSAFLECVSCSSEVKRVLWKWNNWYISSSVGKNIDKAFIEMSRKYKRFNIVNLDGSRAFADGVIRGPPLQNMVWPACTTNDCSVFELATELNELESLDISMNNFVVPEEIMENHSVAVFYMRTMGVDNFTIGALENFVGDLQQRVSKLSGVSGLISTKLKMSYNKLKSAENEVSHAKERILLVKDRLQSNSICKHLDFNGFECDEEQFKVHSLNCVLTSLDINLNSKLKSSLLIYLSNYSEGYIALHELEKKSSETHKIFDNNLRDLKHNKFLIAEEMANLVRYLNSFKSIYTHVWDKSICHIVPNVDSSNQMKRENGKSVNKQCVNMILAEFPELKQDINLLEHISHKRSLSDLKSLRPVVSECISMYEEDSRGYYYRVLHRSKSVWKTIGLNSGKMEQVCTCTQRNSLPKVCALELQCKAVVMSPKLVELKKQQQLYEESISLKEDKIEEYKGLLENSNEMLLDLKKLSVSGPDHNEEYVELKGFFFGLFEMSDSLKLFNSVDSVKAKSFMDILNRTILLWQEHEKAISSDVLNAEVEKCLADSCIDSEFIGRSKLTVVYDVIMRFLQDVEKSRKHHDVSGFSLRNEIIITGNKNLLNELSAILIAAIKIIDEYFQCAKSLQDLNDYRWFLQKVRFNVLQEGLNHIMNKLPVISEKINDELKMFISYPPNYTSLFSEGVSIKVLTKFHGRWKSSIELSGGEQSVCGLSVLLSLQFVDLSSCLAVQLGMLNDNTRSCVEGLNCLLSMVRNIWAQPKFLLMDELDESLDELVSFRLGKFLREFSLDRGIQLILVSHKPEIQMWSSKIIGTYAGDTDSSHVVCIIV